MREPGRFESVAALRLWSVDERDVGLGESWCECECECVCVCVFEYAVVH